MCTKELWPPPPLAFPEPLQGSCSFALPQRALTHALVLLPPAQGATTALLVPWKKRDLAQRLKFRLLGHQPSSYPSMLTFWCPRGSSEAAQLLLAEARSGWGHLLAFFLRLLQMGAWGEVVKRMREEFKPTDLKSRSTPCSSVIPFPGITQICHRKDLHKQCSKSDSSHKVISKHFRTVSASSASTTSATRCALTLTQGIFSYVSVCGSQRTTSTLQQASKLL